ncbi:serine hydrolase [Rhodococcoides yunnanense]|uniref:serine hydrolase n=1 Tax=Rhodococcoides yunnanense TaxID=278209 RepID=UPI000933A839|nr:serine hydrolase [Rhodococcus yunnanensis]
MSRPMQVLAVSCAALLAAVALLFAGCSVPEDSEPTDTGATTESPFPDTDTVDDLALDSRIPAAIAAASGRGAEVDFALLDRRTGAYFASGDTDQVETASVSKLFIADDVLHGADIAQVPVADDDMESLKTMLKSSDDQAANNLWDKYGGNDIIDRVTQRYGLTATSPPWDGLWWNTETTAGDIVAYYTRMIDGAGGLSPASASTIIGLLRESTPVATDGYHQHFGIVDGLPSEPVYAVKQGWMCCIADRWVHLSTGTVGVDNRFVIALISREDIHYEDDMDHYPDTAVVDVTDDSSAQHARDTLTGVVAMLFPDGRVD